MEKYGVDEIPRAGIKLGETELDHCPRCGSVLGKHGSLVLCPIHGSEPFEHAATEQTK